MPYYTWQCSAGHITEKFRAVSKFTETVQCSFNNPRCHKKAHLFLQKPPRPTDPQRIWTATEVHGKKKANSETFAADIEQACFSERGLQR